MVILKTFTLIQSDFIFNQNRYQSHNLKIKKSVILIKTHFVLLFRLLIKIIVKEFILLTKFMSYNIVAIDLRKGCSPKSGMELKIAPNEL